MTSLRRNYRPDFTMYGLQKSPNARFTDCPPVRPLHSSNLRAWISVAIGGAHMAETVEQSTASGLW